MKKRNAYTVLVLLACIFVSGIIDGWIGQPFELIPKGLWAFVTPILTGVAIGALLAGLRGNGPPEAGEGRGLSSAMGAGDADDSSAGDEGHE